MLLCVIKVNIIRSLLSECLKVYLNLLHRMLSRSFFFYLNSFVYIYLRSSLNCLNSKISCLINLLIERNESVCALQFNCLVLRKHLKISKLNVSVSSIHIWVVLQVNGFVQHFHWQFSHSLLIRVCLKVIIWVSFSLNKELLSQKWKLIYFLLFESQMRPGPPLSPVKLLLLLHFHRHDSKHINYYSNKSFFFLIQFF